MAISFVGGTNNYIKIWAADALDDGASWDNPMSFQKIVDYFEANPISSINMPVSADLTEIGSEWSTGWIGGVYTTASQRSNNGDTTIELTDTSGFTATGDIHGIYNTAEYPDYQRYTGITGNNLTGCTWDKYWGNYETARIDTNNIVFQVTDSGIDWDTVDYQVGSESLRYTHNNIGTKVLISRDFRTTDGNYYGLTQVDAYCAETVSFWVKVDNANITLKQVETRIRYSTSGRIFSYGTEWDNSGSGWSFVANTWTKIDITIRDGEARASRDWWSAISNLHFYFENVTNGDIIKLDGVKFYLEDPNPREVTPNILLFPIKIYSRDAHFGTQEFYFYDYGKTIIFNQLHGNFMYLQSGSATYKINLRLGEKDGTETGINIFGNNWAYDENNYGIRFGSRYYDEYCQFNGFNFMGAHGRCGGINYVYGETTSEKSEIRNSNLYNISDFMESQGVWGLIENVGLHGGRYLPRMTTAGTIKNWMIWRGGYSWVTGTLRTMDYQSNFNGYQYLSVVGTVDLIDCVFRFDNAYAALGAGEILNIGYSFNLQVLDGDGIGVNDANVVLIQSGGNEAFNTTTNINGEITSQDVIERKWDTSGSKWYNSPDYLYSPFTLIVSKTGYQVYREKFVLSEKTSLIIKLEPARIQIDQECLV